MAESNNKEILYILVGVGITLLAVATILSFLTYRKVDRDRQSYSMQQPMQELSIGQMPSQIPTSPVVYDDRIYRILADNEQKIHEHLEDVNSNVNSLNNSLKLQYKISSLNTQPRAGSVTTIRTTNEDKTRQKEFGMI